MTTYERETLSHLYASLDFMKCNDLPSLDVESAIDAIECKYRGETGIDAPSPWVAMLIEVAGQPAG